MALTTVQAVKALASITTEDEDDVLTALLGGVNETVLGWLRRRIEMATYTEILSGDDGRFLRLSEYPVLSLTSVYLDHGAHYGQSDDPFPATTLLDGELDYALVKTTPMAGAPSVPVAQVGLIERIGGPWPGISRRTLGSLSMTREKAAGNVKVTYVAGYATVPQDLALAAGLLVLRARQALPTGLMATSESLIDYSVAYAQAQGNKGGPGADTVSWLIGSTLARYRRAG